MTKDDRSAGTISRRKPHGNAASRSRGAIVALSCACCLIVGIAVGCAIAPESVPPSLRASQEVTRIPVSAEDFPDSRSVSATPVETPGRDLTWAGSGIVTHVATGAGLTIESGEAPFAVDGAPVIAIATSEPVYRSLAAGMQGEDVGQLRDELSRLGYLGAYGSERRTFYDPDVENAVRSLQAHVGAAQTGTLDIAAVLWIPDKSVTLASCSLVVGQPAPASIGATAAVLSALRLTIPDDLAPGERTYDVDGVTGDVPDDGVITDSGELASIAATSDFVTWSMAGSEQKSAGMTVSIRLKEPLRAMKVPVGALFGFSDGDGREACVQSGDTAWPVTVVGSSNGYAMVAADASLSEVAVGSGITEDECRT